MMGNRMQRRLLRSEAEKLGAKLARTCKGFGTTADACRLVEDDQAVRARERAFTMLLRRGGSPYVARLSDDTARAFPGAVPPAQALGARAWLAVGLDRSGNATYAVRYLMVPGASGPLEAEIAERVMVEAIQPHLAIAGFPASSGAA